MSYDLTTKMICEALTGTIDREIAVARVACSTAAQTLLTCPDCGDILDENRIAVMQVVDVETGYEGKHAAICMKCFSSFRSTIVEKLRTCPEAMHARIETWAGLEIIKGSVQ